MAIDFVWQSTLDVVARATASNIGASVCRQIVGREREHLRLVDAVVFAEGKHPLYGVALLSVPRCDLHQRNIREVVPVNVYQSDFHAHMKLENMFKIVYLWIVRNGQIGLSHRNTGMSQPPRNLLDWFAVIQQDGSESMS